MQGQRKSYMEWQKTLELSIYDLNFMYQKGSVSEFDNLVERPVLKALKPKAAIWGPW